MNNEERDKKLLEIHGAIMVMAENVGNHGETLYGNSKPGLVKDVFLLQERQDQCPARKASTTEGKRLVVANVMIVVAIMSLLASVALAIFTHQN